MFCSFNLRSLKWAAVTEHFSMLCTITEHCKTCAVIADTLCCQTDGTSSPMAGCQAPNTPTKTTFDLEGLQARCKQLKEELDAARISLNRERETSHLRVSIVETSLTAAKKANVELEVCYFGSEVVFFNGQFILLFGVYIYIAVYDMQRVYDVIYILFVYVGLTHFYIDYVQP